MAHHDETFELVKSLSKSEKRFFRLQSSVTEGDKNYIKLFDAMDAMKEFDSKKLQLRFKNEKLNVSYEKKYLQKQILRSMRTFNSERTNGYKVNGMLNDIKYLYDKGLYEQCASVIVSAKEIAQKNQLYPQLTEILRLEFEVEGNVVPDNPQGSNMKKLKLNNEIKAALKAIECIYDYEMLYEKSIMMLREKLRIRDKKGKQSFDELLNDPLLKINNPDKLPANAQVTFNNIFFNYHTVNNDPAKAYSVLAKNMIILEEKPEAISLSPGGFVNLTHNYMYCCLYAGKYDKLRAFMTKYKEGYYDMLPIDFTRIENAMEYSLFNYTLAMAIYSKDIKLGLSAVEDYTRRSETYEKIISKEDRIAVFYKLARITFMADKLKEALKWTNKMMNETDLNLLEDIQSYGRILNLIIHIELNNTEFLERTVLSTKRFLQKRKMFFKIENVLLEFVAGYLKAEKNAQKEKLFLNLRNQLSALKKDPYEKSAFLYFDYLEWIDKKTGRV